MLAAPSSGAAFVPSDQTMVFGALEPLITIISPRPVVWSPKEANSGWSRLGLVVTS